MKLFTIGFTKSSAEHFFDRLQAAHVSRLIDVRLNNVSQLAGFAKRDDLAYFLREICHIPYVHDLRLAPTQAMLDAYRKQKGSWDGYADEFRSLLVDRRIEDLDRREFDSACLLCSEDEPHHCHRRIVAEYLAEKWGDVDIVHL